MTKKLDTHLLEIFVSVVERKSLTQAGRDMHLVVSAVSKRMDELERHVGRTLLKRANDLGREDLAKILREAGAKE